MTTGEFLRYARKKQKVKLSTMAKAIGVGSRSIISFEANRSDPPFSRVVSYFDHLGMKVLFVDKNLLNQ